MLMQNLQQQKLQRLQYYCREKQQNLALLIHNKEWKEELLERYK